MKKRKGAPRTSDYVLNPQQLQLCEHSFKFCDGLYAGNCNDTVFGIPLARPHTLACCQPAKRFVISEQQYMNHEAHLCIRESEEKPKAKGGGKENNETVVSENRLG